MVKILRIFSAASFIIATIIVYNALNATKTLETSEKAYVIGMLIAGLYMSLITLAESFSVKKRQEETKK